MSDIFQRMQIFLLFNLKMTVERSKRCCFLTLTFLVKSFHEKKLVCQSRDTKYIVDFQLLRDV